MSVRILQGDVRERLAELPSDSFDCIVTSPPYWGLRDYGVAGQIGLESTLTEYLDTMVAVCRDLRRVLKPSGTFWLNVGDSYAATSKGSGGTGKGTLNCGQYHNAISTTRQMLSSIRKLDLETLKPKDLCMVPNRLAIRLQEPWYDGNIRNIEDRIWLAAMIDAEGCMFIHKRKAGADSGAKFTKADGTEVSYARTQDTFGAGMEVANTSLAIIERCIALTGVGSICSQSPEQNSRRKQTIYRWNVRSNECRWIIEEVYPHLVAKQQQARILLGSPSSGPKADAAHAAMIDLHNGKPTDVDFPPPASRYSPGWYVRSEIIWAKKNCMPESVTDRPTISHEKVWLLTKSERYAYDADAIREPLSEPHRKVIGRSVRPGIDVNGGGQGNGAIAQNSAGANCRNVWSIPTAPYSEAHFATFPPELAERCIKAGCPVGGHVLDPFGGAGTTGMVADRLARDATMIELNPAYVSIIKNRLAEDAGMFAQVAAE